MSTLDVDFVRLDHVRVTRGNRVQHYAPQARRGVPLDPRNDIAPPTKSTMIDYAFAWAGVYSRRMADAGLLRFPDGLFTAEDRPWIWRLHLQAKSYAVVNSPGILYRRGVTTSLTQIVDMRQLDFLPAYAQVFSLVDADPDAELYWPKAARQFVAILAHHLNRASQMPADVAASLRSRAGGVLQLIPDAIRTRTLAELDAKRLQSLRTIVATSGRSTR